ncbi:MAG: preprotein translocase subunit SecA [Phycisphaera sp.]|nr:preprotein translocase subunit SecA [Phycisphaera sp.]
MDVLSVIAKPITKVFGTRNDRMVKTYRRRVEGINAMEPQILKLSDPELRERAASVKKRIAEEGSTEELMYEAFAVMRESLDRNVGIRNIFNPEHADRFDASKLSGEARRHYDRIRAEIETIQPIEELGHPELVPGYMQVDIPVVLYDAVREMYPTSRPPFRCRPFDVQLIGGMVLSEGKIAEMKTGEGKTIVAPLACFMAVMEGLQCHVVTVNDYLVQRDRDWVFPAFYRLGVTVGAIHPYHMLPEPMKKQMYHCDIVYGTNSEFGFDYLRDNMKLSVEEQVQRKRNFCIIDEVDSILIDEARTPLIISGSAQDDAPQYQKANQVAEQLAMMQKAANQKAAQRLKEDGFVQRCAEATREPEAKIQAIVDKYRDLGADYVDGNEAELIGHTQYYVVQRERKAAHMTPLGVEEAQNIVGTRFYVVGNDMAWDHLINNAIRAHTVYLIDREYVVENIGNGPEVVIVDENTGRKMIGRQWSDGLHQAIEAKESQRGVKIKQETQTLATVTIQNFFKLYGRLAGMTGTAITEGTEFHEIYELDVVCIPTNLPIARNDYEDLIFLTEKAKWESILDEIKHLHDLGRPVLVGTTSVDKSEMLGEMLTRKHNIEHAVLNAKQHEREAHIVEAAGRIGAVVIATNMAGRGTDIKLASIDRETLVEHWKARKILPHDAKAGWEDAKLIAAAHRHIAQRTLAKSQDADGSDEQVERALLEHWAFEHHLIKAADFGKLTPEQLRGKLDTLPNFHMHRLRVFAHVEELGGLHIIGTERHEARRIDNQLRGRAGRQGDRGSSRFFISMEDDLMKMFAGERTIKALSMFGMQEGDAIEHRWITRSVEKAQRKVEERNYQIRKNLLEYDEVMEYQRNSFYGTRQLVLEGEGVKDLIFDYIAEAIEDAVAQHLARDFAPERVAEALKSMMFNIVITDPTKLRGESFKDVEDYIRSYAKSHISQEIENNLGEYIYEGGDAKDWDLKGLSQWAMKMFSVDLKQSKLREMSVDQIAEHLNDTAYELVDRQNLEALNKFYEPGYAQRELAAWARLKFGLELTVEELSPGEAERFTDAQQRIAELVYERADSAYRRREIEYPVEFVLDMAFGAAREGGAAGGAWAAEQLSKWAKRRYDLDLTAEQVGQMTGEELRRTLMDAAEQWAGDKLDKWIDTNAGSGVDNKTLQQRFKDRFGIELSDEDLAAEDRQTAVRDAAQRVLRMELMQLEQYVLLQILDSSWKDHLYAMDQLKDSIGLVGYAEKDPKIEYKAQGSRMFQQMMVGIRDKVTDMIFKARLTAGYHMESQYKDMQTEHEVADSTGVGASASLGTAEQRADLEAAQRAGGGEEPQVVQTIVNTGPQVGRNDPCPCGSGKKYKKCHGK